MLQGLGSSAYWHETSQRVPNPAVSGASKTMTG